MLGSNNMTGVHYSENRGGEEIRSEQNETNRYYRIAYIGVNSELGRNWNDKNILCKDFPVGLPQIFHFLWVVSSPQIFVITVHICISMSF